MEPDEKIEEIGFGADESASDPRTVKAEDLATADPTPLIKGGHPYSKDEILHQHKVGICTAISLVQNRNKANKKKYSADFQYLIQKKEYDQNWSEGSSAFMALKVGKNVGFLPENLWTHTTEKDRYLPYDQYIAKLQAIPVAEINRLKALCIDKIPGYAKVDHTDPQALAKAINDSEAGLIVRYNCGNTWYTDKNGKSSWDPEDINPLRIPVPHTSGHLIIMSEFDYSDRPDKNVLANTWGRLWCNKGCADIHLYDYAPTEAWTILRTTPVIKFKFTKLMKYGTRDYEVIELQKVLNLKADGIFGRMTEAAVKQFQQQNGLKADGVVGPKTRAVLNN